MKTCIVCNYVEKDNSSLFCSNCGKTFRNLPTVASRQKIENQNQKGWINEKISKYLGYFIITSLLLDLLVWAFTGLSGYLILSIILTLCLVFVFIKFRYSYDFNENEDKDEFNGESPKIRPPSFGFHW